ncbi:hypothetical protein [Criblamydia sequanensis]|nr:hypothetical protein [Criblamydia sequanensis]
MESSTDPTPIRKDPIFPEGNIQKDDKETLQAPNGIEFLFDGPSLEAGIKPLFLYFALSKEASLKEPPFNRPITTLKENYKTVRLASVSLPFHNPKYPIEDAMSSWSQAFKDDPDFLNHFIENLKEAVLFLIAKGIVSKERLGFGGLSRGGYIAGRLASLIKAKALLVYAPLTELTFLSELKEIQNKTHLKNYSKDLGEIEVRAYIGNRDQRVGTRNCFDWIESIVEEQYKDSIRSPKVELILSPSIGHKGHGTPPFVFDAGAHWMGMILTETGSSLLS